MTKKLKVRFKSPQMQSVYVAMRQLGSHGVIHGSVDDFYRRGLRGFSWKGARNSLNYAAWAAGNADHRKIAVSMRGAR